MVLGRVGRLLDRGLRRDLDLYTSGFGLYSSLDTGDACRISETDVEISWLEESK